MKKVLSLFLIFTLLLSLTSCGTLNFVDIEEFSSEIYTDRDITSAMEIVLEEFQGKNDRILLSLSYIEINNATDCNFLNSIKKSCYSF